MLPQVTTFSLLVAFSLLATVLAGPTVIKDSPITVPLVRHLNLTGTSIVESDKARAHYLKTRHLGSKPVQARAGVPVNVGITNTAVSYTAKVTIGTSGQSFNLIVDTGSANTWVGADLSNPYVPSGLPTGLVSVTYGSGSFTGLEYTDQLSIGPLTIPAQSFGDAVVATGFQGVDGILGVGPTGLTKGTLVLNPTATIPTVTDNAYSLGLIPNKLLGIYFQPTTSLSDPNGELTFGGTDSSKYTGSINYVPITSTSPASHYVGIDQTVTYNGQTILASSGIVDTGTTLLYLASDAFNAYISAIGAVYDPTTKLYEITAAQYATLQSLFFTIGGTTYEFTKNAQIWPRSLNTNIGGSPSGIYLIVANLGSPSGQGLDFINGLTFLERFYTVYNSGSSLFGITTTSYTLATSN